MDGETSEQSAFTGVSCICCEVSPGAGAAEDLWLMIGIIEALSFEVHQLTFPLMQVWAKKSL